MPELPKDTPEHIRDTMIIILNNLIFEADKVQLTIQQFVWQARARGIDLANIEQMLLEDLRTGGQIFGEFRKNFKNQMRYSLEEVARGEVYSRHKDVEFWEWVAVHDNKLCPDCANRNGRSMTLDRWRREGLPGAGRTICQRACRCALTPAGSLDIPKDGINRERE